MVNLKAKTFREAGMNMGMMVSAVNAFSHPHQVPGKSGNSGLGVMSIQGKKNGINNTYSNNSTSGSEQPDSPLASPSQMKGNDGSSSSGSAPVIDGSEDANDSSEDDDDDYRDEPKQLPAAMRAVLTKNQMRRMSRIELMSKAGGKSGGPPAVLKRQPTMITGRMSMFNGTGLTKLLIDDLDKVNHEDFDAGVNAMALLCALLLSVPYAVVDTIDNIHLAWLQKALDKCKADHETMRYSRIYALYRGSFLSTVYMSIGGMILATFYFLFKRTNEEDYKLWRRKARLLVTTLFFFTALAICSLLVMTNTYFNYFLLSDSENICDNNSSIYMVPGLLAATLSFTWSFYLIL